MKAIFLVVLLLGSACGDLGSCVRFNADSGGSAGVCQGSDCNRATACGPDDSGTG